MTKAEIISDILTKAGTTSELAINSWPEGSEGSVTGYQVVVLQVGEGGNNKSPQAVKKSVNIYVYNEGEAEEAAYYHVSQREGLNQADADITGTTLEKISKIHSSVILREKCLGAILKASYDITNEDPGTANHAERLSLAIAVMSDIQKYLDVFMSYVATNATVQTSGVSASDNDIQYIVNSNWDAVAIELYGA